MIRTIETIGDRALLVRWKSDTHELQQINQHVHLTYAYLHKHPFLGFLEANAAYDTLLVVYDVLSISHLEARERLQQSLQQMEINDSVSRPDTRTHRVPVCYDEPYALDIQDVCKQLGISKQDLIQLHTRRSYPIYFHGFLPGFPFMGPTCSRLHINRKSSPRVRIPRGSVAIADDQTGIYPSPSPGGWHIIGQTPLSLLPEREGDPIMRAGDIVTFFAISAERMKEWEASP
ncbi:5-oxoprolinase subunit PxpB [Bacillus fonticola]|uniref:5-oxoprolinase subunit PxpB n=1 Tax=Bacillus fonticola TaxID=2728853 RepID=UPI001474FE6B|nr:5-oxoprolinase subunit PxpB [Bacillus fonticola]